jgi:hypothetical protein
VDSFLGFAVLAASLGPGFVFERVAERRRPRPTRSTLAETVELVVTGSIFTLLAALVVLTVAHATHWLDVDQLATNASSYLIQHPARGLTAIIALYVLSFALAVLSANIVYLNTRPQIEPGVSPWHVVFLHKKPADHAVFVTVSLRDGRQIAGALASYTLETGDNRELALVQPMAMRREPHGEAVRMEGDDFVILRETDIARIGGRYVKTQQG